MEFAGGRADARQTHSRVRKGCWHALALGLILASSSASANITCDGKIAYLGLSPDGSISVSVGYGVWYLCSQTTAMSTGGVPYSPEGCRAWYASLLAAQKADQKVRFFFSHSASTSNGAECLALGDWNWPNPAPYHLNLQY
jgi:hypothetical protein